MKMRLALIALASVLSSVSTARAQSQNAVPESLVTPDKLNTSLGALEFKDGVPSDATAAALYDHLDQTYAFRAYMDNLRGVSIRMLRQGIHDAGAEDERGTHLLRTDGLHARCS